MPTQGNNGQSRKDGALARPAETERLADLRYRERVNGLRGRFKGKGLLKALMAEKKKERG